MRHATFLAILVATGCSVLVAVILVYLLASAKGNPPLGTIALIVRALSGLIFRQWWCSSGLKMVLSAQHMLVAIDTEHNTREIVEALRRSQTVPLPRSD